MDSVCTYLYWGLELANFDSFHDTAHFETSRNKHKMASRPTVNVRSTSGGNCFLLVHIHLIHILSRGFLVSPNSRCFDRSNCRGGQMFVPMKTRRSRAHQGEPGLFCYCLCPRRVSTSRSSLSCSRSWPTALLTHPDVSLSLSAPAPSTDLSSMR